MKSDTVRATTQDNAPPGRTGALQQPTLSARAWREFNSLCHAPDPTSQVAALTAHVRKSPYSFQENCTTSEALMILAFALVRDALVLVSGFMCRE